MAGAADEDDLYDIITRRTPPLRRPTGPLVRLDYDGGPLSPSPAPVGPTTGPLVRPQPGSALDQQAQAFASRHITLQDKAAPFGEPSLNDPNTFASYMSAREFLRMAYLLGTSNPGFVIGGPDGKITAGDVLKQVQPQQTYVGFSPRQETGDKRKSGNPNFDRNGPGYHGAVTLPSLNNRRAEVFINPQHPEVLDRPPNDGPDLGDMYMHPLPDYRPSAGRNYSPFHEEGHVVLGRYDPNYYALSHEDREWQANSLGADMARAYGQPYPGSDYLQGRGGGAYPAAPPRR